MLDKWWCCPIQWRSNTVDRDLHKTINVFLPVHILWVGSASGYCLWVFFPKIDKGVVEEHKRTRGTDWQMCHQVGWLVMIAHFKWCWFFFKVLLEEGADIEWSNGRRVDCVLCSYIYNIVPYCGLALFISFRTTVDDIEWSDSRRVDCVLCSYIYNIVPYCGLALFISFRTTVDDIEWSNGRMVDCVLCSYIYNMIPYCMLYIV